MEEGGLKEWESRKMIIGGKLERMIKEERVNEG